MFIPRVFNATCPGHIPSNLEGVRKSFLVPPSCLFLGRPPFEHPSSRFLFQAGQVAGQRHLREAPRFCEEEKQDRRERCRPDADGRDPDKPPRSDGGLIRREVRIRTVRLKCRRSRPHGGAQKIRRKRRRRRSGGPQVRRRSHGRKSPGEVQGARQGENLCDSVFCGRIVEFATAAF